MDLKNDTITELSRYLTDEFTLDNDEITEMLDLFFTSMDQLITEAEKQIAIPDFDQIATTGHTIKGSAANINALGISSLGLALENGGNEKDLPTCQESIASLKNAMELLKSEYEQQ